MVATDRLKPLAPEGRGAGGEGGTFKALVPQGITRVPAPPRRRLNPDGHQGIQSLSRVRATRLDARKPQHPPPSPHVFISYARDGAAGDDWAGRIEQRLGGLGIACWRGLGVEPDQAWSGQVPAAIEAVGVLVCVVSRASKDRDWVHRELTFALARRKPILPVLVEPGAELPFEICNQPPLNLADPDDWAHLERRCRELLGLGAAPGRQAETACCASCATPGSRATSTAPGRRPRKPAPPSAAPWGGSGPSMRWANPCHQRASS